MLKYINRKSLNVSAGFTAGLLMSTPAHANNFSNVAENMSLSLNAMPGLLATISYIIGALLGVLGVMKIKDHVENPAQTPIKDGAIRLAAGGALFAIPFLFEAMTSTIGQGGQVAAPTQLQGANIGVS